MSNEIDRVAAEIAWFSNFYKRRAANVARLAAAPAEPLTDFEGSLQPELHILVCAGLDSLARHWAATFKPALNGKGQAGRRMGEFLVEHGSSEVLARVSAPNLLYRAIGKEPTLVPVIRRYLGQEGSRGSVRTWEHDPKFSEIADDPDVGAGRVEWIRKSRYGEVLYRELRCMWLHELRGSNVLAEPYDLEADAPRYQNLVTLDGKRTVKTEQRLMFPVPFLTRTYAAAVASFQRACIAARVAPRPDEDA